jgi:hypothetical protein
MQYTWRQRKESRRCSMPARVQGGRPESKKAGLSPGLSSSK